MFLLWKWTIQKIITLQCSFYRRCYPFVRHIIPRPCIRICYMNYLTRLRCRSKFGSASRSAERPIPTIRSYKVGPRAQLLTELLQPFPIASMYGISTYIYHKNQPNVGKYTIHGCYGFDKWLTGVKFFTPEISSKWFHPSVLVGHHEPRGELVRSFWIPNRIFQPLGVRSIYFWDVYCEVYCCYCSWIQIGLTTKDDMMMIIPSFIGFYITIPGGARFIPSTVC